MNKLIKDLTLFRSNITLKLVKSIDFNSYFQNRFNKDHQIIWLTKDITLSYQNNVEERRYQFDGFSIEGKDDVVLMKVLWYANIYKEIAYVLDQIAKILFTHIPGLDTDAVLTKIASELPSDFEVLEGKRIRSFLRSIVSTCINVLQDEYPDAV